MWWPRRTHSQCISSTHCVSKHCGQHAAPHSRPGTVTGVCLATTHGLRRQPPRARRNPGPAFDPMFRHARGGGAMCATGCVAGHSAVDCPLRTCLCCSRRSRARRHRPLRTTSSSRFERHGRACSRLHCEFRDDSRQRRPFAVGAVGACHSHPVGADED
jgi:hypothetical protein